jgi:hypothetical protein
MLATWFWPVVLTLLLRSRLLPLKPYEAGVSPVSPPYL